MRYPLRGTLFVPVVLCLGIATYPHQGLAQLFLEAVDYGVGSYPRFAVTEDFDGDGALDLAVVNEYSEDVSVLLGRGDGTFDEAISYHTWTSPHFILAADFNEDQTIDLVVSHAYYSDTLSILFGNGDGTFTDPFQIETGSEAIELAAADFNGDGLADLAVSCYYSGGTVLIYLGRGDGTFDAPIPYQPQYRSSGFISVSDFNEDGLSDLAVACPQEDDHGGLTIFLGVGDGTFEVLDTIYISDWVSFVGTADFNGDSDIDLAIFAGVYIDFLWGQGTGSFGPWELGPRCSAYYSAVADVDGDGNYDIVCFSGDDDSLSVCLGHGNGTFTEDGPYYVGHIPWAPVVGDFDGNGSRDVAVTNKYDDTISILINRCHDLDGDGYNDEACGGVDCDDEDPSINPAAQEICGNGIDDDCDGDEDQADDDGDGYIDEACGGDDCNDEWASVNPGVPEDCDTHYDDNCNGIIDEGCPCFISNCLCLKKQYFFF